MYINEPSRTHEGPTTADRYERLPKAVPPPEEMQSDVECEVVASAILQQSADLDRGSAGVASI